MNSHTETPVFVHAWWRASTTWFWAKLRGQAGLRCYYEPLNERLAYWNAERLRRRWHDAEALRLAGHPPLERPYFAEYLGLYEAGGTGYATELAYERYLLLPGEPDAALERYLAGLIGYAARAGERPVLCFVRSPLRALWMRRAFGGLHLAQLRNPRDQWGSFLAQGGARSYFTAGMLLIAARLRARVPRALSHLAAFSGPGARDLPALKLRPLGIAGRHRPMGPGREYAIFTLLWLASALQSLSAADLVLDSDRLSMDAPARRRAASLLAAQGLPLDLSDAAVSRHAELPLAPDALQRIEELALRQLAGDARPLAQFDPARVEAMLGELAPFSRALLEKALAALRAP